MSVTSFLACCAAFILVFLQGIQMRIVRADEWPTVRHDPARTGVSDDCPLPPYEQAWVAYFPDEIIATRCEAIVADGRVFVGTYSGRLRALDAQTGRVLWTADLGGPILHSPCVVEGVVYASSMKGVWALEATTGNVIWQQQCSRFGFCTSPTVASGLVMLGGRDGVFYALESDTGRLRWKLTTGGPIRTTAAVAHGKVFFASEDMHAYAAEIASGRLLWKSEKLAGQTLRDYYPVVCGNKVILRSNPVERFSHRIANDTAFLAREAGLPDNHWKTIADYLNTKRVFGTDEQIHKEQEAVRQRLTEFPWLQSFFVLDENTGNQSIVAPVLYTGGCGGVGNMPVVADAEHVIVIYRTAYGNFTQGVAPFIGLGYLNVVTGQIAPIYHQHGPRPPWGTFWGTADEAQNLSLGQHILYFSHQGTLTAFDLAEKRLFAIAGRRDTWGGYKGLPWVLNEWHGPARGSVAIAGPMLFWITGSRVIAIRGRIK